MTELRRRAEDQLKGRLPVRSTDLDADREHLIHEMDVRQAELEIQNEELKRLRDEAEELAAKYMDIYDFAPIGYVTLNPEGVIVQANLTAASMIGKLRADLIGRPFLSWIDPASGPGFWEFLKKVFRSAATETFEAPICLPDQAYRQVQMEASLSPASSECRLALIDVTARRKAEEAVREKDLQYRDLVQYAASAIIRWRRDGIITFFNEYAQNFFGYRPEEIIGKPMQILLPRDGTAEPSTLIANILEHPEHYQTHINENVRADGSRVWMNWTNRPIRDPNGRISEILAVGSDITAVKEAEELLLARQKQLEDVNRELESFSYSISHDLQTPLRAIDGFSRMILRHHGGNFDEETQREFDIIRANVKQMGQLITDLLAFSRLGKRYVSVMPVDVQALFQEAWNEQVTVWPGRAMTLTLADLPPAYADQPLIKQVIANLLANAVKFSQTRSRTIVEVSARAEDQQTVYCIKDNGVGFDMAYAGKLFGMFQTLHDRSQYEGTGVGLAIAQRIIFRHGGKIWAEGEPERGATFFFSLPSPPPDQRDAGKLVRPGLFRPRRFACPAILSDAGILSCLSGLRAAAGRCDPLRERQAAAR